MTIEYKLYEQDFLDFQLFAAYRSERIQKKKRNGTILLTLGSLIVAIYCYFYYNLVIAVYFAVFAVATALFYPRYFKWRYKKHYQRYIRENYAKRFGLTELLELKDGALYSRDKVGEGKINVSEIDSVDETDRHFFIRISSGISLIIPKAQLKEPDVVRKKFLSYGLDVNQFESWK